MALTATTLREGSFSVASMARGKSICSPALASILSGEESAISGAVELCAEPLKSGVLVVLGPPGGFAPCHNRVKRIAVGTSAPPNKAAISPFKGRLSLFSAAGEFTGSSGSGDSHKSQVRAARASSRSSRRPLIRIGRRV